MTTVVAHARDAEDPYVERERREFDRLMTERMPGARAGIPVKQGFRGETVVLVRSDAHGEWSRLIVCRFGNHLERARGYVARYNEC